MYAGVICNGMTTIQHPQQNSTFGRIKAACKSRRIHVCLRKRSIVGKIGICSNNISFGIFIATK